MEAELLEALGSVALVDAGHASAEAGRAFARAVELCRSLGGGAPLAAAGLGLWIHRLSVGDLAGALELADEAVALAREQLAREQPAAAGLARALAALGMTHSLRARPDLARPLFEEVLADPDAYDPAARGGWSGGSVSQGCLARVLAMGGALEQSAAHAVEAIERTRRAGHLTSLVAALATCCGVAWLARDPGPLRDRTRELAGLAETHGYPLFAARARIYAGWVAVEEDRVAEGVGAMAAGLAAQRATGAVLYVPWTEAMLSDAHLLAGNAEAALEHVEEALRVSARTGEAWLDAELHRRLACALLRLDRSGDAARAEAEFRRALEVARSQSALLFELRAARDLARLRRDQGRLAEARGLLAPVYAAFTEGFASPDLVEARALLEELGAVDVGIMAIDRVGLRRR